MGHLACLGADGCLDPGVCRHRLTSGGSREGDGHCRRMVRQNQNGQYYDWPVSADGVPGPAGFVLGGDLGCGNYNAVFWRGVFYSKLEMSLEITGEKDAFPSLTRAGMEW